MRYVFDLPEGTRLPPLTELLRGRPTVWSGMQVEWLSPKEPEPVFITRMCLPVGGRRDVHLFGARYELSEALVGGEPLGAGYFVEYVVSEASDGDELHVHRLLQSGSVTFSSTDEQDDYLPALEAEEAKLSIHSCPRWRKSEAVWPTYDGAPMRFLGQVTLPENEVTRTWLTWDVTLYLFWSPALTGNCFKLLQQEGHFQTAEQHYDAEA